MAYSPNYWALYVAGVRYSVGHLQLISLNDGNEPFAYVVDEDIPLKDRLAATKHRPLSETESDALESPESRRGHRLDGTERQAGTIRLSACDRLVHQMSRSAARHAAGCIQLSAYSGEVNSIRDKRCRAGTARRGMRWRAVPALHLNGVALFQLFGDLLFNFLHRPLGVAHFP